MGKQFFYASGETISARLPETEAYPECTFAYTPLTRGEHAEVEDRMAKGDAPAIATLAGEVIARHVKSWNVVKGDGSPVDPKKEAATNRLVPQLTRDILGLIYRTSAGEPAQPTLDAAAAEAVEEDLKNC